MPIGAGCGEQPVGGSPGLVGTILRSAPTKRQARLACRGATASRFTAGLTVLFSRRFLHRCRHTSTSKHNMSLPTSRACGTDRQTLHPPNARSECSWPVLRCVSFASSSVPSLGRTLVSSGGNIPRQSNAWVRYDRLGQVNRTSHANGTLTQEQAASGLFPRRLADAAPTGYF